MGGELIGKFAEQYEPRNLTWEERLELLNGVQQRLYEEVRDLEERQRRYQELARRIEKAESVGELKETHHTCNQLAMDGFLESYSVRGTHGLCSDYRDRVSVRLLKLVEGEMMEEGLGPPPTPYAWMAMGSDGRAEQTLFTDQDNLLVYEANGEGVQRLWDMGGETRDKLVPLALGEEEMVPTPESLLDGYYEIFSRRMAERLDEIGVAKCKGGVMPMNEKWRSSLGEWEDRIEGKIHHGTGDLTTLDLIILMDLRYVGGDSSLATTLTTFVNEHIGANPDLLEEMARSAILMAVPLGLFGRFITEKSGDHKGMLNLKLGGWAPLVLIIRILAKRHGVISTNTLERIDALQDTVVFNKKFAEEMRESYHVLLKHRFLHQIESIRQRSEYNNYIDPHALTEPDQEQLKRALRAVEACQKFANRIFFSGGVMP
jgi:CBS domain-containing protein